MASNTVAAIERLTLSLVKANADGERDPLDDLMDSLIGPKPPKKPAMQAAPMIVDSRPHDKPEEQNNNLHA